MTRLLALLAVFAVGAAAPAQARDTPPTKPLTAKQKAAAKKKACLKKARTPKARKACTKKKPPARKPPVSLPDADVAPQGPVAEAPGEAPGTPATDPVAPSTPDPTAPSAAPLPKVLSVSADEYVLTLSRSLVGAGTVLVELRNVGEDPHDLVIETAGGTLLGDWADLAPTVGGRPLTDVKSLVLTPGPYVAYCSLTGHLGLGMKAQFTVQAG